VLLYYSLAVADRRQPFSTADQKNRSFWEQNGQFDRHAQVISPCQKSRRCRFQE
jgi:hypothetical protein